MIKAPSVGGGSNHRLCDLRFQDLLHFSSKGQFDEAGQTTLNGLEQQEQTPVPSEAQSALEQQQQQQQPENHPLQIQAQQEESAVPTQSTMTADDMRRAKRIRVSREPGGPRLLSPSPLAWTCLPGPAGLFLSLSYAFPKHLIPSNSLWAERKTILM